MKKNHSASQRFSKMLDSERLDLSRRLQSQITTGKAPKPVKKGNTAPTPAPTRQRNANEMLGESRRAQSRATQEEFAKRRSERQAGTTMTTAERKALAERRRQAYEAARRKRAASRG